MPSRLCKDVTIKTPSMISNARNIDILPALIKLYNIHSKYIKSECPRKQLKEISKYTSAFPERDWLQGLAKL